MATLTVKMDDALYRAFADAVLNEHCSMAQKVRDLVSTHVKYVPSPKVPRAPATPEEQAARREAMQEGAAISYLTGHAHEPDPELEPFLQWLDEQWVIGAITDDEMNELLVEKVTELLEMIPE